MDVLSDLLRAVRLSGAVFFKAELRAPWALRSPEPARLSAALLPAARRMVLFHYVQRGSCWVELGGEKEVLGAGDVVVMPFSDPHEMGTGHAPRIDSVEGLFPGPPPWSTPPRLRYGGEGEETQLVCGYLHLDEAIFNPLLTSLPSLLVVRSDDSPTGRLLRGNLDFVDRELERDAPGAESVLSRLSELLFVQVLRQHIARLPERQVGWLAALRDPGVGRALEQIHARPAHAWTVDELARRAAMSRSAFAARFQELLADPPDQYLTRWRVQLASQRLRETDDSIALIGGAVGYASEAAFSRAFKREVGVAPASFRRGHRTAPR